MEVNMTFNEFLSKCTSCGGNWTAMFMTGIQEVAPDVYEQMPDRCFSFDEVGFIVSHLCHDRPHLRFNRNWEGYIIEYTHEGKFVYRRATPEEINMSTQEFELKYNNVDMAAIKAAEEAKNAKSEGEEETSSEDASAYESTDVMGV